MSETIEKIISSSEREIQRKGEQNYNEKYIQRTIIKSREGGTYKTVSDIIQTKIKKKLPEAVIEHMKWPKFGIPAGQPRGSLEPGIIEVSNEEIHIQDRSNPAEADLGEKIRESIQIKKDLIIKEMEAKREKENLEKLAAFRQNNASAKEQKPQRTNKEGTIRISGFNPNMTVKEMVDLFSKAGDVRRCTIPNNKNVAYLEYYSKTAAEIAFEMFNDTTNRNCILSIQILPTK
ncbi:MAG: hypothetical protein MJ252_21665 [archaeon]|nr:hypothetical protein [archaeon]